MKYIKKLMIIFVCLLPFPVFAYSNYIIPGGENVGIEVKYKGVLVIGYYKVNNKSINNHINIGDYIVKINNEEINTINELTESINKYVNNNSVSATILRNGKYIDINLNLSNENDKYKTGLYVKDSLAGIGTISYIDPSTNIYGALGHEIMESNTKKKVDIESGSIFESKVSSIDRSVDGNPGTKNAKFNINEKYGTIEKNTDVGIYGKYNINSSKEALEVGKKEDLKLGEAKILTVLNNKEVLEYKINITKIDKKAKKKNIYFEIVDEELLSKTGGIVQGMSGSPIIQDNKIFGAVTHVVIDNVKNGYGIFITTMLEEGEK